jgi:uncharacterized membrane protein SpoIIM required for sporulation
LSLRSTRFRNGREDGWKRLEILVGKLEKKGLKALSAEETAELPRLYQSAVSSLAVARNVIIDKALLHYLENLTLRAYLMVYGPRAGLFECLSKFFRTDFPLAVRALKFYLLAAFLVFLAGFASGASLVSLDPWQFENLAGDSSQGLSPYTPREYLLEKEIYAPFPGLSKTFVVFANFLFRNNSRASILCFGLSLGLGVPTALIGFHNGLLMGAYVGLHAYKDLTFPYLAWLSIHGVTELLAFFLSMAAGFRIAAAIIYPGRETRLKALARKGKEAGTVMAGAIFMLFLASILEGGFRGLLANDFARLAVAAMTALWWWHYFSSFGKENER